MSMTIDERRGQFKDEARKEVLRDIEFRKKIMMKVDESPEAIERLVEEEAGQMMIEDAVRKTNHFKKKQARIDEIAHQMELEEVIGRFNERKNAVSSFFKDCRFIIKAKIKSLVRM